MKNKPEKLSLKEVAEARAGRLEMQHLLEIEGNPFSAEDIAMFEMFERERWSHEQRQKYLDERVKSLFGHQSNE